MIRLKRLNGEEFVLNCDLIEILSENPDTVITLVNGHKFVVKEDTTEIIEKIKEYKSSISIKCK